MLILIYRSNIPFRQLIFFVLFPQVILACASHCLLHEMKLPLSRNLTKLLTPKANKLK